MIMSAKIKRALRKKRYLDKEDVSQLYMKEYRESNRNAIREVKISIMNRIGML